MKEKNYNAKCTMHVTNTEHRTPNLNHDTKLVKIPNYKIQFTLYEMYRIAVVATRIIISQPYRHCIELEYKWNHKIMMVWGTIFPFNILECNSPPPPCLSSQPTPETQMNAMNEKYQLRQMSKRKMCPEKMRVKKLFKWNLIVYRDMCGVQCATYTT